MTSCVTQFTKTSSNFGQPRFPSLRPSKMRIQAKFEAACASSRARHKPFSQLNLHARSKVRTVHLRIFGPHRNYSLNNHLWRRAEDAHALTGPYLRTFEKHGGFQGVRRCVILVFPRS